jgi:hypothetical protein
MHAGKLVKFGVMIDDVTGVTNEFTILVGEVRFSARNLHT